MTAGYLLFLVVGRVLIFFLQKFTRDNIKIKFFNRLLSCSLCTGFWTYSILSALTGYYVFWDWTPYTPVFSELAAGGFSALLVYYLESGWRAYHEILIVE